MFAGHIGVAYAAKRKVPALSLGWLFIATMFIDILWPIFVLTGVEHVRIAPHLMAASSFDFYDYPWSHSLVAAIGWGILAGLTCFAFRRKRDRLAAALVFGALVVSHWVLDVAAHRPDLTLAGNHTAKFGRGLWNSIPLTLIVELGILAIGFLLYLPLLRRDGGTVGIVIVTIVFIAIQFGNVLGPLPPNVDSVVLPGLIGFPLFALVLAFLDRKVTRAETSTTQRIS